MSGIIADIRAPQRITAAVGAGAGPVPAERQVVFAARAGFPEQGRAGTLYVATDEGRCYYFAGVSGYKCVGSDAGEIKEIICGLQEENNNG